MADTLLTLAIKDGTGTASGLSAISASTGYSTYHALTGTLSADISSSLSSISSSIATLSINAVKYATGSVITPVTYTTLENGTKTTISAATNRSNLTIFNHTNGDLYIAISSSIDVATGKYTYVLTSSGSYYSEKTDARLEHTLTGSTAMSTGFVTITEMLF